MGRAGELDYFGEVRSNPTMIYVFGSLEISFFEMRAIGK
jgi:hypothetical protein